MVHTAQYKLIVYPKASKILLFDLKKDPEEMHDLSGADCVQMQDELDLTACLKEI